MTDENFKRYIKATHEKCRKTEKCSNCALMNICLNNFNPEEFIAKVDEWCEAHPAKTYAQDFLKNSRKQRNMNQVYPI